MIASINQSISPDPSLHFLLPSENNQLFHLVYEHVQVTKENLNPHLWAYRFCITLEHLSQTLQQQNMKKKCPILYAFLHKVLVLEMI